ncbi:MAG TPA: glycosyltransferase [Solirubrobacter sp.]|nr:glycosyltransferase [Solirubrobacter sp.]
MPTYKRTQWLAGTIRSALDQTFTDLVVEVHDDATPGDAVARVVDQFDDPRVKLIRYDENAGIVGNFTRSLLGAQTEYVIQLGDDDEAHPQLVEKTVAALDAHPSAGVAHARFELFDAQGNTLVPERDVLGTPPQPLESGHDFVAKSMVHGCRINSSTALIRRSMVPEGGFWQVDFPAFDLGFWLRIAERSDMAFIAEPLCRYRLHEQSHTSAQGELTSSGYLHAEQMIRDVHAVKIRHIESLPPGPRRDELRRIADRTLRRDIVGRVRELTLPDRPFAKTVRGLGRAARREPSLLREPTAWALLAGSVLGPRAVERLRGRA